MIRGNVSGKPEVRVRLRVRGPTGNEVGVTATVDTGFTGALTLPDRLITSLDLPLVWRRRMAQADGSEAEYEMYAAEVEWDGDWRPVLAARIGRETLLGMDLLLHHELRVQVVPGGAVEITPLP